MNQPINVAVEAANKVMQEAHPLIRQDFPGDGDEVIKRGLKLAFNAINANPRAVLHAQALRQEYAAFRQGLGGHASLKTYSIRNYLGHEVGRVETNGEPIPDYAAQSGTTTLKLLQAGYIAVAVA